MSRTTFWAIAAVAALAATAAGGHEAHVKALRIVHPYTVEPGGGEGRIPVFMTIQNIGKADDFLIRASSSVALSATLLNGEAVAPKIPVPKGGKIGFTRAAFHIVLDGVNAKLSEYQTFPLTLVFEKAGSLTVDVLVEEASGASAPHHD